MQTENKPEFDSLLFGERLALAKHIAKVYKVTDIDLIKDAYNDLSFEDVKSVVKEYWNKQELTNNSWN